MRSQCKVLEQSMAELCVTISHYPIVMVLH